MSNDTALPFFSRIGLAISLFFKVLFDGRFAAGAKRLAAGQKPVTGTNEPAQDTPAERVVTDVQARPAPVEQTPQLRQAPTDSALQLLGLMQREGRLLDFLMEDMSDYGDADIGSAARVVHDDCRKALLDHLDIERIFAVEEGDQVTVTAGFNASEIRLVGQVSGQAPFRGALAHGGWRAKQLTLPKLSDGHDLHVIAPAEVEL